jgi:hypothetical protein
VKAVHFKTGSQARNPAARGHGRPGLIDTVRFRIEAGISNLIDVDFEESNAYASIRLIVLV